MFKANSNWITLEILKMFGPKLGKLVSKLEVELKKWKKLELDVFERKVLKLECYQIHITYLFENISMY